MWLGVITTLSTSSSAFLLLTLLDFHVIAQEIGFKVRV
jgi:hypothetical protein